MLRINDNDTLGSREPKLCVGRSPSCGLSSIAFAALHAIGQSVNGGMDIPDLARGKILKFSVRDTKDTLVRTDPRVSSIIKKNVPSRIVRKAILSADGNELSITDALDSRGLCGDPKRIWS